ncbi:CDC45-like protein, partial [Fragilariopsis cylindrus CCMP1102]
TALLLCNADVDAMSSARILSYMLRSDGIHYQLLPCTCYSDLERQLTNMVSEGGMDDVSSIVLLNFGATYNLTRLFGKQLLQDGAVKIYVMDCRRPIHLANVYSSRSIVVFFDSAQKINEMPSDGDNLSGDEESSSSDDSDDSDEEDDSSDDDNNGNEGDDDDEEEANFDDTVEGSESGTTAADNRNEDEDDDESPKTTQNKISPRELHSQRRNRLRKYYTDGSYFGSPAAFVAYNLATQLRYGEKGDLLWLACVGVTDAYLHSRLDMVGYAALAQKLSDLCVKLFPNNMYDRALNTVYAEDLIGKNNNNINNNNNSDQNKTKIALSENGRIFSEKDFRFFMLRHSNLLDSMQYSEYVCTRLQVYTKRGEQQLMEMLAKMGYPLDECRQPFPFMKPNLRRRLKEKLGTHAPEYNLDRFEFTSFTRVTGYQSMLSASDASYAVTALLEYETPNELSSGSDDDPTNIIDQENKAGVEAFNNAYDALGNLSSTIGIGAGLRRAMALQKSIIHTAVGLSERGSIALLRHFRYAHVTSTSRDHIFSKPLALTRLAHFLMNMNRENGKWTGTKARPLVLIADKPRSKTCLIVGYEYPERAGDFVKNTFGPMFKQTAESMNGMFKFDSFDSNVVEVDAADVQRFMEQLH